MHPSCCLLYQLGMIGDTVEISLRACFDRVYVPDMTAFLELRSYSHSENRKKNRMCFVFGSRAIEFFAQICNLLRHEHKRGVLWILLNDVQQST